MCKRNLSNHHQWRASVKKNTTNELDSPLELMINLFVIDYNLLLKYYRRNLKVTAAYVGFKTQQGSMLSPG